MYQSGTSMSAPLVSGAAALLLEVNPKLTPGMVRMILQYTAQPIAGADMLEQGAGQLNVEGAVRLTRSLRTNVNFATLSRGANLLPSGTSLPTTFSDIAGGGFSWSQIVTANHNFTSGPELVSKFQLPYRLGGLMQQGLQSSQGTTTIRTNYLTTGITVHQNLTISNGGELAPVRYLFRPAFS